jgi:hypothetical protein
MKRTTFLLPDDLVAQIERERQRRDVSAATIVREAIATYFAERAPGRKLGFIGIWPGEEPTDLASHVDDLLAEGWVDAIEKDASGRR